MAENKPKKEKKKKWKKSKYKVTFTGTFRPKIIECHECEVDTFWIYFWNRDKDKDRTVAVFPYTSVESVYLVEE